MMHLIFTIIVPVYNTVSYLEQCVQSLLAQTLRDIEIILVDDGSTDGSGVLCDTLAARDARVRVIHKANAGQGLARNEGLNAARGQYVMFVDSDDTIESNACEILHRHMTDYDLQVCCYGYAIEDRDGNVVVQPQMRPQIYEGDAVRTEFVLHYFGDSPEEDDMRGVSACMTAFRRDMIDDGEYSVRFPSEREVLSEDAIFSLEVCLHVDRAGVVNACLYHYYQNPTSFSHAYRSDRFEKTLKLCSILRSYAICYDLSDAAQVRIHMLLWINLMACIRQEYMREGVDRKEIRRNVESYCSREETQEAVRALGKHRLGIKQDLFLTAVRLRWYAAVEFMVKLRNRRGL